MGIYSGILGTRLTTLAFILEKITMIGSISIIKKTLHQKIVLFNSSVTGERPNACRYSFGSALNVSPKISPVMKAIKIAG